jgi:hypothetical protein
MIEYLKPIRDIVWTIFSKFKFSLKFEKKLKNAKACTVKLTEALKNCPKYCRARTPEEIANIYTSLTLEQVYATILYYLHNKEAVGKYITEWLEWGEKMRE